MSPEVVYYVSNVLLFLFWCASVNALCENRFSWPVTLLLDIVSSIGYMALTMSLPLFSLIRLFAGIVCFVLLMLFMHLGKRLHVALVSFMVMVTTMVSEMLYMTITPREAALSGELFEENTLLIYTGYLFLNALMLSITVILMRTVLKRYKNGAMGRLWLLFPVFPICQFATFLVFFDIYVEVGSISDRVLWLIVIYVISDVVLFLTLRTASRNAELNARNSVLEEQVNAQEDYYRQLAGSFEEIRKMRHDIDNHLYTMQALLDEGQLEEASEYNKQILENDGAAHLFSDCQNTVAAAYLEKKLRDYEKEGIRFETDIRIPANLRVSNPDLICILGNLLDNAEEACRNLPDPWIELKTSYREPYLTISCRNAAAEESSASGQSRKNRRIAEMDRGVGFTILNSLAERCDGEFTYARDGQTFSARMIIKGGSAQ